MRRLVVVGPAVVDGHGRLLGKVRISLEHLPVEAQDSGMGPGVVEVQNELFIVVFGGCTFGDSYLDRLGYPSLFCLNLFFDASL